MISSFLKKFKTQTSESSKQMYSFLPKFISHINSSQFRKINWPSAIDRVEYGIANTVFKY